MAELASNRLLVHPPAQADTTAANLQVALKSSNIVLPVVGGTAAAHAAGL